MVLVDAMRVGLIGQVRRHWTARGVKVRQRVKRRLVWRLVVCRVINELWHSDQYKAPTGTARGTCTPRPT
jgi:hypothetical protein